ncbi:XIAP-associated factor 1 [Myotis brandtii]|uniref:XIAP-associated factor 1 n=1 Tax=Myotis brandtii TaxID=109478 RepID=S7MGX6_MYOBR|nr:XIAP-associated factor 1 [Myotis brandtii]
MRYTCNQPDFLPPSSGSKRRVASPHLALHEAHCVLFLAQCPECKEPVLQAKMDEHCENGHQQVGCAMCQQSMQKSVLAFHETRECKERPVVCEFCRAAVRLSKLEIHEHHCGNRIELCLDCGQPIMLRTLAQHRDACQSEQAQHRAGEQGGSLLDGDKCRTTSESAKYFPTEETGNSPPSLPRQAAKDQTPTAVKDVRPKTKNANRFPLLSESSTKQAPRGTDKTLDLPLKPEHQPWVVDDPAYDILRRCPQCDILLPLPTLNQHQVPASALSSPGRTPSGQGLEKPRTCRVCADPATGKALPCLLLCVPTSTLSQHFPPGLLASSPRDGATFEGRASSFISVSPVPGPGLDHSKCFKQLSK